MRRDHAEVVVGDSAAPLIAVPLEPVKRTAVVTQRIERLSSQAPVAQGKGFVMTLATEFLGPFRSVAAGVNDTQPAESLDSDGQLAGVDGEADCLFICRDRAVHLACTVLGTCSPEHRPGGTMLRVGPARGNRIFRRRRAQ